MATASTDDDPRESFLRRLEERQQNQRQNDSELPQQQQQQQPVSAKEDFNKENEHDEMIRSFLKGVVPAQVSASSAKEDEEDPAAVSDLTELFDPSSLSALRELLSSSSGHPTSSSSSADEKKRSQDDGAKENKGEERNASSRGIQGGEVTKMSSPARSLQQNKNDAALMLASAATPKASHTTKRSAVVSAKEQREDDKTDRGIVTINEMPEMPFLIEEDLTGDDLTGASGADRAANKADGDTAEDKMAPVPIVKVSDEERSYRRAPSELTMTMLTSAQQAAATATGVPILPPGLDDGVLRDDATDRSTAGSTRFRAEEDDEYMEGDDDATLTEEELAKLEPWQRALFAQMRRQNDVLKEIRVRMDVLTDMVVANQVSNQQYQHQQQLSWDPQRQKQQWLPPPPGAPSQGIQGMPPPVLTQPPMGGPPFPPPPTGASTPGQQPLAQTQARQMQPGQEQQLPQPQPQPHMHIFPLFVSLFTTLTSLPRRTKSYILSTRIVRIIKFIWGEADRQGIRRNLLDGNLLFKLIFVCVVFASRIGRRRNRANNRGGGGGNRGGNRGGGAAAGAGGAAAILPMLRDALLQVWDAYRVHLFVVGAVLAYLVQTGAVKFWYDVVVKGDEVRRIWRGEDGDEEDGREGEGGVGEGVGEEAEGAGGNAPHQPAGANDAAAGRRVQQRDGGGEGAGVGGGAAPMPRPAAVAAAARPPRPPQPPRRRNLVNGGIRRRPEGRRGLLGLLHDLRYLTASFVLSLLPTWKPEVVEEEGGDEGANARGAIQGGGEAGGAVNEGQPGQGPEGGEGQ